MPGGGLNEYQATEADGLVHCADGCRGSPPRLSADTLERHWNEWMSRVRKIPRQPDQAKNYFVVDACFLANKYLPSELAPVGNDRDRIDLCMEWWDEIEEQLEAHTARVYVPDICIAETFRVIAKKYYQQNPWFPSPQRMNGSRLRLRRDIVNSAEELRKASRVVKYHDVPTSRDIIISVDRFNAIYMKHRHKVSTPDLILVATAKYLMDFFDFKRSQVHIVTLDRPLRQGTKKISELPNAYDPTLVEDRANRVFA